MGSISCGQDGDGRTIADGQPCVGLRSTWQKQGGVIRRNCSEEQQRLFGVQVPGDGQHRLGVRINAWRKRDVVYCDSC